jgi:hypothetical protein
MLSLYLLNWGYIHPMFFSTNFNDVQEYTGLRREILDNSHGTFIFYFTHSEKEHPNHGKAESHARKSLVEYSIIYPVLLQTLQNHLFMDFNNALKFEPFA